MDSHLCPLCGRANQCAMLRESSEQPCWCFAVTVAPKALAQLTPEQRNQACLCPSCAQLSETQEPS